VPPLVNLLKKDDGATCESVRMALVQLCETWGAEDRRTADIYARLGRSVEDFSFAGQQAVFKLHGTMMGDDKRPSDAHIDLASRPLQLGMQSASKDVRGSAYELMTRLVRCDHASRHLSLYREFLRRGLKEDDAILRARAVCAATATE